MRELNSHPSPLWREFIFRLFAEIIIRWHKQLFRVTGNGINQSGSSGSSHACRPHWERWPGFSRRLGSSNKVRSRLSVIVWSLDKNPKLNPWKILFWRVFDCYSNHPTLNGLGGVGVMAYWLVRWTPYRAILDFSRRGQCVVFLGKALYSHSASLHPGV